MKLDHRNRILAAALLPTTMVTPIALAQAATPSNAATQQPATPQPQVALQPPVPSYVRLNIPHSSNPFHAYTPTEVAPANLANSARLDTLIHNGVLEISLQDAISLALENNLDLAIARYNIPIAEADILRTKAGGSTRGVNTGVVQNTPGGGGAGSFGLGSTGAGVGGTSGGAGGAGAGASGLVHTRFPRRQH